MNVVVVDHKENQEFHSHHLQQQQFPSTAPSSQMDITMTVMMNNYEKAPDSLKSCFSMISVDLEDDCSSIDGGGGTHNMSCCSGSKSAMEANVIAKQLQKQVEALEARLRRSEEEKEQLRKEKTAQRRELANLRKCLKSNDHVLELQRKVDYMTVERDYFVREIRMLEDKVDELEKINDAKSCQLQVFDKLSRTMPDNNINKQNVAATGNSSMLSSLSEGIQHPSSNNSKNLSRRNHRQSSCPERQQQQQNQVQHSLPNKKVGSNNRPPETITLSTCLEDLSEEYDSASATNGGEEADEGRKSHHHDIDDDDEKDLCEV